MRVVRKLFALTNVSMVLMALVMGLGQQQALANSNSPLGSSSYGLGLNNLASEAFQHNNPLNGIANAVPNVLSGKPLGGLLGGLTGELANGNKLTDPIHTLVSGLGSAMNGFSTGGAAALGSSSLTNTASSAVNAVLDTAHDMVGGLTGGLLGGSGRAASSASIRASQAYGAGVAANMRREALANNLANQAVHREMIGGSPGLEPNIGLMANEAAANLDSNRATISSLGTNYGGNFGANYGVSAIGAGARAAADLASGVGAIQEASVANTAASVATETAAAGIGAAEAAGAAAAGAGALGSIVGPIGAGNVLAAAAAAPLAANALLARRPALAAEALGNARAEAAIAGADMAAHGANNARSASLASNAYRQAKLAGARDRVNIAGTIQNTARISDAAIATHDTATKAEDSLLGSELAVDSAATVLDSDAAYIPPVTNSLLRSLPYGRLGLRNIVPKPLTYPSTLLPDVWLNGAPVSYVNAPLRMLPYGVGPTAATNPLQYSGQALAHGLALNGQPFHSNNGLLINGLVVDPQLAYLALNGVAGSSILPVLANGQLEAQDEIAMAHTITNLQKGGPGMAATYGGYGRMNPVPMLTGSVTDANLTPTTTVGTTYPIGSALVIEPRDSYFQDHIDSASSRQNFDERQQ